MADKFTTDVENLNGNTGTITLQGLLGCLHLKSWSGFQLSHNTQSVSALDED
jgi:hypothetical protein